MEKKGTVLSIKTYESLKNKVRYIAEKEHRSMAMQVELFLSQKLEEWEKANGKIPLKKPSR